MNYQTLDTLALEELKTKASQWLRDNPEHPRYAKGLTRYIAIVDELRSRKNRPSTLASDIIKELE